MDGLGCTRHITSASLLLAAAPHTSPAMPQLRNLRKEVAELMRTGKQGNARIRCGGGAGRGGAAQHSAAQACALMAARPQRQPAQLGGARLG